MVDVLDINRIRVGVKVETKEEVLKLVSEIAFKVKRRIF